MSEELSECIIDADRHKLAQVIRNFISNALKFTPAGGTVTVKAFRAHTFNRRNSTLSTKSSVEPDTAMLRLQVIDSGHGISKVRHILCDNINLLLYSKSYHSQENIPKVFNEIVQFNSGELQNGGGSGLGLWSKFD